LNPVEKALWFIETHFAEEPRQNSRLSMHLSIPTRVAVADPEHPIRRSEARLNIPLRLCGELLAERQVFEDKIATRMSARPDS